jgi:hypothetical protein
MAGTTLLLLTSELGTAAASTADSAFRWKLSPALLVSLGTLAETLLSPAARPPGGVVRLCCATATEADGAWRQPTVLSTSEEAATSISGLVAAAVAGTTRSTVTHLETAADGVFKPSLALPSHTRVIVMLHGGAWKPSTHGAALDALCLRVKARMIVVGVPPSSPVPSADTASGNITFVTLQRYV